MTVRRGVTLFELLFSVAVVGVLLAILLPALSSARTVSHRDGCANNQRLVFQGWTLLVDAHDGRFPAMDGDPAWEYGGVRFSSTNRTPFLDLDRPLNRHLPMRLLPHGAEQVFACPSDRGVGPEEAEHTCYAVYGTSYRANAMLLSPQRTGEPDGLPRDAITTAPSRLVVMGDGGWHELRGGEATARASWHGEPGLCNVLFLDGSVTFVSPKPEQGPALYDPRDPRHAFPVRKKES